jgi:outer membrane protein OmpA-like peptidoglycan-associated protein
MPRRLLLVALAASFLPGCAANTMKEENALLRDENKTLRAQLEERNGALDSVNQELRDRSVELAELRRRGAEKPKETGPTGFEGIAGVTGSMSAGEVTATVESDILFDPGKATLRSAARKTLDAVAQVLNQSYGGKSIRIAGHTDTDPIKKSGHASNYHLGFERAFAVREYLVKQGVSSGRIYLASHGPDRPRGSKDASRRVEIIVVMN